MVFALRSKALSELGRDADAAEAARQGLRVAVSQRSHWTLILLERLQRADALMVTPLVLSAVKVVSRQVGMEWIRFNSKSDLNEFIEAAQQALASWNDSGGAPKKSGRTKPNRVGQR
jgi:hypothetical protein